MAKLAAAVLWVVLGIGSSKLHGFDEPVDLTAVQLKGLFSKFDANKDGKATVQEITAFANQMSKASSEKNAQNIMGDIDTNKDGKLSLAEHLDDLFKMPDGGNDEDVEELEKSWQNDKVFETAKFKAADENGDGFLAPEELGALFFPAVNAKVLAISVKATMDIKDKDGDAMLTPKEFWEFEEFSEEDIQDFQKLDQDGDGLLNAAELAAWESGTFHTEGTMLKLMEIADKNGDMAATLEELENAQEEIAASVLQHHLIQWADNLNEWAEHHEL